MPVIIGSQQTELLVPAIPAIPVLGFHPSEQTEAEHAVSQQAVFFAFNVPLPWAVPTPLFIILESQVTSPVPFVLPEHFPVMSVSQQSAVVEPMVVAKSVLVWKPVVQTEDTHAVSQHLACLAAAEPPPCVQFGSLFFSVPLAQLTSPDPPVLPEHFPVMSASQHAPFSICAVQAGRTPIVDEFVLR